MRLLTSERMHAGAHKGATGMSTLELTGPAVFTDVMARYAAPHAPRSLQRSHPTAVLPRVAWGANPAGFDGVLPTDAGVLVLHAFKSSWRPPLRCRAAWWRRPPNRKGSRSDGARPSLIFHRMLGSTCGFGCWDRKSGSEFAIGFWDWIWDESIAFATEPMGSAMASAPTVF